MHESLGIKYINQNFIMEDMELKLLKMEIDSLKEKLKKINLEKERLDNKIKIIEEKLNLLYDDDLK